jgi:hypothetical protein
MSKKHRERSTPPAPTAPPTPSTEAPAALAPHGFDYKKLALASPLAEFEAYGRQKVKTAQRIGEADVEVLIEAFELGRELLAKKPEAGS